MGNSHFRTFLVDFILAFLVATMLAANLLVMLYVNNEDRDRSLVNRRLNCLMIEHLDEEVPEECFTVGVGN